MEISSHFSEEELTCKCGCGYLVVNPILIRLLESIRETFGKPVNVLSGCRCEQHNINIGGVSDSQHLYGTAADIYIEGVDVDWLADVVTQKGADGVGVYRGSNPPFVHVDVRGYMAYWEG
jgi:uncharacterized protein YcbK (DUF882 family)